MMVGLKVENVLQHTKTHTCIISSFKYKYIYIYIYTV